MILGIIFSQKKVSHLLVTLGRVDQTDRGSSDWQCTIRTLTTEYLSKSDCWITGYRIQDNKLGLTASLLAGRAAKG